MIPDGVMLWVYIIGAGVYAGASIIFWAYHAIERGGTRNHWLMSLALFFLAVHHAILAVRNFRYWFSITETVALTRIALLCVLVCSILGFCGHLRYRWRVRNE